VILVRDFHVGCVVNGLLVEEINLYLLVVMWLAGGVRVKMCCFVVDPVGDLCRWWVL
jgi:hypothetical protein